MRNVISTGMFSFVMSFCQEALSTDVLQAVEVPKHHGRGACGFIKSALDSKEVVPAGEETSVMVNFFRDLKEDDPHDLSDMIDEYYDKGDLENAAKSFVAAALYGISDYQNELYHLDKKCLKHMINRDYRGLDKVYEALLEKWKNDL